MVREIRDHRNYDNKRIHAKDLQELHEVAVLHDARQPASFSPRVASQMWRWRRNDAEFDHHHPQNLHHQYHLCFPRQQGMQLARIQGKEGKVGFHFYTIALSLLRNIKIVLSLLAYN